jgi:hypothetical protein
VMCKLLRSRCSLRVGSQKGASSLISTELGVEESLLLLASIRRFLIIYTNFSIVWVYEFLHSWCYDDN